MGGTECQSLSVRRASCCYQFTHRTNREQRPTAESALPHPDPSNMIRQLDLHASTWLAHVSSISQLLHRPQPYKACLPRPPTPSVHSIIPAIAASSCSWRPPTTASFISAQHYKVLVTQSLSRLQLYVLQNNDLAIAKSAASINQPRTRCLECINFSTTALAQ